ncbi:MAG: hypothetical protein EA366_07685 [Spirulina sp. DLM2.Bin59]|nr:MAG: hypothetical protein EA366_07685 [Spirulina sp. DLM2.Bin59]
MFTRKLLLGLSLVASLGAIAAQPAWSLTIDFDDAETNYRTYTHNPDPDALYRYGQVAAIHALTDGDFSTNVELYYSSEDVTRNVGFDATVGNYTARVTSVTTSDWQDYGAQWRQDLFTRYNSFQTSWDSLSSPAQTVFEETFKYAGLGDPNIAQFAMDASGGMTIHTVGFYDLRAVLQTRAGEKLAQYETLAKLATATNTQKAAAAAQMGISTTELNHKIAASPFAIEGLTALLATVNNLQETLQASEVARVDLYKNGEFQGREYAYSFNAVASGITALDDGESYSGVYTWTKPGNSGDGNVPEPTFLLATAVAGGLFSAAKRKQKQNS